MRRVVSILLFTVACDGKAVATPAATTATSPRNGVESPSAITPAPDAREPAPTQPSLAQAGPIHYLEVILGDGKPDDKLPMIVAIHGLGDDPANFAHVFDSFPESARLILPRGIDEYEEGGWSWFPIRARDRNVEALAGGIKTAADKLAEALKVLPKKHPTAGLPIVTGFSQGGMLAFTLAVHHPDATSLAVPVGGWLPPPLWPESKVGGRAYPPVVALHGTADNAVRYAGTKEAVDHLASIGLPVELKSYEGVPHALTTEIRRDLQDALVDAVRSASKL